MDRRERLGNDLDTLLLAAMQGHQAGMWTALPGIVESFNPSAMTVSIKPSIKAKVRDQAGATTDVELPLLVDCPVVFPGGGGFTLTFPIKPGDECLVVFSSRCIDCWWESGGVQVQADLRMHDLSDGFALVGVRSMPRKLDPAVSTSAVQLRNDAGTALIKIDEDDNITAQTPAGVALDAGGDVYVTAGADLIADVAGQATIQAPTIALTGNVTITGNLVVTGTMMNDDKNVGKTHIHSGVSIGASNTGQPV